MDSKMHVSLNELENVTYKALESLKIDEGACALLSKGITFLESIGMHETSQFVAFLLSHRDGISKDEKCTITMTSNEKDPCYVFDGNNISCIHFVELCVEYIISLIKKHRHFTIEFHNSYDYMFFIPYLQRFSSVPISIQWHDTQKKQTMAFIFPENVYPEFFFSTSYNNTVPIKDMVCAYVSDTECRAIQDTYAGLHVGIEQCNQHFQKSIAEGIYIDKNDWKIIRSFEKNVLVPNSEVSRSGAGEVANAIDREDILFTTM